MQGARGKFLRIFPGFKNFEKAQEFMEQVYQNAPAGKTAPLALMNLARIAQQEDDSDAAIDALDRLVNNHAQSILAPDAHLRLAGIYASLVKVTCMTKAQPWKRSITTKTSPSYIPKVTLWVRRKKHLKI